MVYLHPCWLYPHNIANCISPSFPWFAQEPPTKQGTKTITWVDSQNGGLTTGAEKQQLLSKSKFWMVLSWFIPMASLYKSLLYPNDIPIYWVARNIIPSAQDPRKPQSLHGFGFVVRHHGGHTQQNHLHDRTDDLRIRAKRNGIQWDFMGSKTDLMGFHGV